MKHSSTSRTSRTPQAKAGRASRLAASAKAKGTKREIAAEQTAVRAAQAAVPHDRTAVAKARDQQKYVAGEYTHRLTGSKIRLLDTMAPDAPRSAISPDIAPDAIQRRYAVQCLDHGSGPRFFATLKDAERAVRDSPSWCQDCMDIAQARTKVQARNKAMAKPRPKMLPAGQVPATHHRATTRRLEPV